MSGSTPNYHWTLPTIGGDASSWGTELNADLGLIDAQVKVNEDAITALQGQMTSTTIGLERGPDGGPYGQIVFAANVSGSPRWILFETSEPETGGNAGTNFGLNAYNDAGAYLGSVFSVSRATQRMTLAQDPVSPAEAATKHYVDASGPIGSVVMWATAAPPTNWAFCNGSILNIASYPALFAVLGTAYGGNGTTTFGLPNMLARMPLAYDGGGGGAMGAIGGEASHTLAAAEMPVHTHPDAGHGHGVTDPTHMHVMQGSFGLGYGGLSPPNVHNTGGSGAVTNTASTGVSVQTGYANVANAGGGAAHNNMPPYFIIGFIIRCF